MQTNVVTPKLANQQVYVRDQDIISDEDQMRLMQMRDSYRANAFEVGYMANRYAAMSIMMKLPVTIERVHEAIGNFLGVRPRTIRGYAEVAAFYNDKDITEFETLPFSFFVLAIRHGEVGWREVLEYAALNPMISYDGLRKLIQAGQFQNFEKSEFLNPEDENRGGISEALDPFPRLELLHRDIPGVTSGYASHVLLSTLGNVIEQALHLMRMVSLPDPLRQRIEIDLDDLRAALPEIKRIIHPT